MTRGSAAPSGTRPSTMPNQSRVSVSMLVSGRTNGLSEIQNGTRASMPAARNMRTNCRPASVRSRRLSMPVSGTASRSTSVSSGTCNGLIVEPRVAVPAIPPRNFVNGDEVPSRRTSIGVAPPSCRSSPNCHCRPSSHNGSWMRACTDVTMVSSVESGWSRIHVG